MPPVDRRRIRVLVIDPMPLARKALSEALRHSAAVEVVAAVSGVGVAEHRLSEIRPEAILLDLQPPLGPELARLRALRAEWPIPVALFTALGPEELEEVLGALDVPRSAVVSKPAIDLVAGTSGRAAVIEGAIARVHLEELLRWTKKRGLPASAPPRPPAEPRGRVIAIGASTGGTEAIAEILGRLPGTTPGLVIVQHMPAAFTRSFAERLDRVGELEVREASDGDPVRPGLALLAPGGLQMTIAPAVGGPIVRVGAGPRVNGHCPSVNVLMESVARVAGRRGVGVLLTGMGDDGASGMKAIRDAGGGTIAQDEASSVVYGMPREAYRLGGAAKVLPIGEIPRQILDFAYAPDA